MHRHTLLWELRHQEHSATDCEAWSEDGAVHVIVRQDGNADQTNQFADSKEAVRWATGLEQTLLADGWTKFI